METEETTENARTLTDQPAVYVGTYAKYNNGSIKGEWLYIEDYKDKESFLEACALLHADESDPELMFQDHQSIPEGMISESHISDDVFRWMDLDDREREIVRVYLSKYMRCI